MSVESIRILCDEPNPRHPKRKPVVQVTQFQHIGGPDNEGRWTEFNRSPYRQKRLGAMPDTGTTLIGDEVYSADAHGFLPSDEQRKAVRSVYELRCPKCPQPYQYRQEVLFKALNMARHAGEVSLTLAQLDAIVQHMGRRGT